MMVTEPSLFLGPPRCGAPPSTLSRDLPARESGIGVIALASALVAAEAAICNAAVAMTHHVLPSKVVTAVTLRDTGWRSRHSSRDDPQVIEVHAAPVATGVLDPRQRGQCPAPGFVQAPAC